MDIGEVLVYIALVCAVGAAVLSFISALMMRKGSFGNSDSMLFFSKVLSLMVFTAVSLALLLLYHYFTTSNMNIKYVWEYSSVSHPIEYKLSGVLAGMQGSLLFWIWCMTLTWFVEEIIDLKRPKNRSLMAITRLILMTVVAVFLYFLTIKNVFEKTPDNYLSLVPDGNGLNPLLQTPLMIVHPPVVFLAYGFCVICMAASVAYLLTGERKWWQLSLPWGRWAWLFLTLGIGIGGLWAYVVLGWGGYWAWDPVETSSFLPWLLLTALLHAQLMNKRKNDYQLAAPALGIYTFVLIIFATFTTRAGGIWQSVHAFGSADVNQNAFDRFIEVTFSDGIITGYFLLMLIIAVGGAAVLVYSMIARGAHGEAQEGESKTIMEDVINDKSLMFLTLIVLCISTIVTLILLILAVNGTDRNQFDTKVGLFAMAGVILLIACLAWKHLGRTATMYSLLFSGGLSVVLGVLFSENWIVATTMPFLVLALGVSFYKILRSINKKSLRGSLRNISPHIIHLGVVLIFIGFVGSNFLFLEKEITLDLNGPSQKVGNYEFRMVKGEYVQDEEVFVTIEVLQDGNKIDEAKPGAIVIDGELRNEIDVVGLPQEDIYLVFISANQAVTSTTLTVKILPLMSLLWGGMWLLALGILLRLAVDYTKSGRAKEEDSRVQRRARMRRGKEIDTEDNTGGEEGEESEEEKEQEEEQEEEQEDIAISHEKSDDYYEELIEKELEEMDNKPR